MYSNMHSARQGERAFKMRVDGVGCSFLTCLLHYVMSCRSCKSQCCNLRLSTEPKSQNLTPFIPLTSNPRGSCQSLRPSHQMCLQAVTFLSPLLPACLVRSTVQGFILLCTAIAHVPTCETCGATANSCDRLCKKCIVACTWTVLLFMSAPLACVTKCIASPTAHSLDRPKSLNHKQAVHSGLGLCRPMAHALPMPGMTQVIGHRSVSSQ